MNEPEVFGIIRMTHDIVLVRAADEDGLTSSGPQKSS